MNATDIDRLEMYEYLDNLREGRTINMLGARPYLMRKFGLNFGEAREVLAAWVEGFNGRHERKEA